MARAQPKAARANMAKVKVTIITYLYPPSLALALAVALAPASGIASAIASTSQRLQSGQPTQAKQPTITFALKLAA